MPKIFSETGRESIRCRLLEIGKNMLLQHSCQQITVDEIVLQANIAKGTFYNFFPSKNGYLKAIIQSVNEEDRKNLEALFSGGKPNRGAVRKYLLHRFADGYTLYDYFSPEELRSIQGRFPTEGENPESSQFLTCLLSDQKLDSTARAVIVNLYNVLAMTATQLHKLQVGGKEETMGILSDALLDQIYGRENVYDPIL